MNSTSRCRFSGFQSHQPLPLPLALEVGSPHRALQANALDDLLDLLPVGLEPLGRELPAHGGGIQHAMAQQPVILPGHEAGLVGPVFEEVALGQQPLQPDGIVVAGRLNSTR